MSLSANTFFAIMLALSVALSAIIARRSDARTFLALAGLLQVVFAMVMIFSPITGGSSLRLCAFAVVALAPTLYALGCYGAFVGPPPHIMSVFLMATALAVLVLGSQLSILLPSLLMLVAAVVAIAVLAVLQARQSGRDALLATVSGFLLVAGAAAYVQVGLGRFSLFDAAAQLGFALACSSRLPVKQEGWLKRPLAVRGKR